MGHCKSSNPTIAACAPLGGRSQESTVSCAEAQTAPASAITETRDRITRRWTSIFFISVWVLCFDLIVRESHKYLRRRKPHLGFLCFRLPPAKLLSLC